MEAGPLEMAERVRDGEKQQGGRNVKPQIATEVGLSFSAGTIQAHCRYNNVKNSAV